MLLVCDARRHVLCIIFNMNVIQRYQREESVLTLRL